jgi:hypothetical protein
MKWKHIWHDWGWTAVAVATCLAAWLLYTRAWHVGFAANALGLLGCHFARFFVLIFAGLAVVSAYKSAAGNGTNAAAGPTVLEIACVVLSLTGCLGFYPVWPVILVLSALPLVLALLFWRRRPVEKRESRIAIARVGIIILLFTLSWYLCSSVPGQALRGLGARIEDRVGARKLRGWAGEVIAARKPGQPPPLEREALPDWVDDLLGPFQGVRGGGVEDYGNDPHVTLYTGGSAYHFQIRIYPSEVRRHQMPWWMGDDAAELQPGIHLSMGGK